MKWHLARFAVVGTIVGLYVFAGPTAAAVHLFPNFPGDPAGDCGAKLSEAPEEAAANVFAEGFFFVDESDGDNAVEIQSGESVTWEWFKYCHSVTSTSVPKGADSFTTVGGPPTGPESIHDEVQLVKPEGEKNTFTLTFTVPGTYQYQCVHHASVGMTGEVVVTAAEDGGGGGGDGGGGDGDGGGGGASEGGRGGPEVLGQVDALPATGGGALGAGLLLAVLGSLGFRLSRR